MRVPVYYITREYHYGCGMWRIRRTLDLDIGTDALRLLLCAKDGDELAAVGAEYLHAKLLGVKFGNGIEAGADRVVGQGLDLVDRVRVAVLRAGEIELKRFLRQSKDVRRRPRLRRRT